MNYLFLFCLALAFALALAGLTTPALITLSLAVILGVTLIGE